MIAAEKLRIERKETPAEPYDVRKSKDFVVDGLRQGEEDGGGSSGNTGNQRPSVDRFLRTRTRLTVLV